MDIHDHLGTKKECYPFSKSDVGAQSAWKGFSSQTLYIASRIVADTNNCDFFPEDIEDLVVKKDGDVIEAIQVKNISSDLTLSSLASTKSSKHGEGFFNRICSLHASFPLFSNVRIIYFNNLGEEINGFLIGKVEYRKSLLKKLTDNHGVSAECAEWLLSSLIFEKVSIEKLQAIISNQLKYCVPIMAAPHLAQSLLVQYVSDLSKSKGCTNLKQWEEQIYQIGTDIAAIDGYYKEYQKSLLRLCDLTLDKTHEQLKNEFEQGVSAHPTHIRNGLDFHRTIWLNKINETMEHNKATIVKGVSGQGKSTLCYRYLIDHYPEQLVFCVRTVASIRQAENLAIALKGIAKHTSNMIVYIDVNPGDHQWIQLIQELQARGVSIPVLVSIREEDFKMTRVDDSSVNFDIIELNLSKQEALAIYDSYTATSPHSQFRSFEEAWIRFGAEGPLIEFAYLLTNNQTLRQRLQAQINNLLLENCPDSWFSLLQLVCYAGQSGCHLIFDNVKKEVMCNNIFAAIHRLSNEYLIKTSEDGIYIEALHPLRAEIICNILNEKIGENSSFLMLLALKCVGSTYLQLLLMDYFSKNLYSREIINEIAAIKQHDWITCAGLIKTMLWLDVKRYVEQNREAINAIIKKHGGGWLMFLPLDISGLTRPDEFIVESLASTLDSIKLEDIRAEVDKIKRSLTSIQIDYEATDLLVSNCTPPLNIPANDNEWSKFGYSLFWFAKRKRKVNIPFSIDQLKEKMLSGDIKSKADAIRGIYEQNYKEIYNSAIEALNTRIIKDYCLIHLNITDQEVQCYCVPSIFDNDEIENIPKNFNHYWKMKVFDILHQMYSEKDYVEVELVGVDLLQDLGIEAHDYKARVHKSYRPDEWITEINAWEKSRIDYNNRPDSWDSYVSQIDEIRKNANKLVVDTIGYIEFLYEKQRHSKERWDRLESDLNTMKKMLFYDILLPKTVVDSYCLFSEEMNNINLNSENFRKNELIIMGLSFNIYANFRKSFRDTYSQLENYYNQFAEVLLTRINAQSLDIINNPRLSLINLFGSAKALLLLQKEYNQLFNNYRTLKENFDVQEIDGMLTLLNVWSHVFDHRIKGYSIAYDSKQLFRKSKSAIEYSFEKAIRSINGEVHIIDDKIYLVVNYDPLSGEDLANAYKNVVLILRDAYRSAQLYNSVRWFLETSTSELIYVPIYKKIPLSSGFQIPVYRILDVSESQLSDILLPTNLPNKLYSELNISCDELNQWKESMGCLVAMKMLIAQYNDVINKLSLSTAICEKGVERFIHIFTNQLSEMATKLSECNALPLKAIESVADEDVSEAFSIIQSMFDDMQLIHEPISALKQIENLEQKINDAVGCMILLQPHVLKGSKVKNES